MSAATAPGRSGAEPERIKHAFVENMPFLGCRTEGWGVMS